MCTFRFGYKINLDQPTSTNLYQMNYLTPMRIPPSSLLSLKTWPCGPLNPRYPCMKNPQSTTRYLRRFLNKTQIGENGYPCYRRRNRENGGFQTRIRTKIGNQYTELDADNRWVVPYSPILAKMLRAHINDEYCNKVTSIKYLRKYVNKVSDMTVYSSAEQDTMSEETQYQLGR